MRAVLVVLGLIALACAAGGEVTLVHRPAQRPPLDAAGVHRLSFAVEVFDERPGDDPRLVAEASGLLGTEPVRSKRDVAVDVREAIEMELRSRDLEVVPVGQSDVLLRVRLEHFFASPGAHVELVALVDAMVGVVDVKTGRTLIEEPFSARADSRSVASSVMKSGYEAVLNQALARFAAKVGRHPDVLISVQRRAIKP